MARFIPAIFARQMRELNNLLTGCPDNETRLRLQLGWGQRYSREAGDLAMERQIGDLQDAANRYLERARLTEAR